MFGKVQAVPQTETTPFYPRSPYGCAKVYAREYVEAMWLMLQQPQPDDYVIATNETHSVRKFVETAFRHVNLDWQRHVEIDPRYYRPTEVDLLIGDASKAKEKLGWQARTRFVDLVKLMADADVELLQAQRAGRIPAVPIRARWRFPPGRHDPLDKCARPRAFRPRSHRQYSLDENGGCSLSS